MSVQCQGTAMLLRLNRQPPCICVHYDGWSADKFKKQHPEVNINLVVENTRRCCQAVARGDLDFAVVGGKVPSDLQHLLLVNFLPLPSVLRS